MPARRLRLPLPVAALLLLGACEPLDLCPRAADTWAGLAAKARCTGGDAASYSFDEARCTAATATCSAAEDLVLERYFTCLDGLPDCRTAGNDALLRGISECAASAAVRPACLGRYAP